jgi:hypothetical protein
MKKFTYEMNIEAKIEQEANAKMMALTSLSSKLTEKELTKLAHVIKHDPAKTALAKKYLGV